MATTKKAAPKKAAPKATISFIEEVVVKIINWDKVPSGTYFTCLKDKTHKITGQIQKGVGWVYFLSDNTKMNGMIPSKMLYPYKYSWLIKNIKDPRNFEKEGVYNIELYTEAPDGFTGPRPRLFVGNTGDYEAEIITKDLIHVGCQRVTREQIVKVLKAMDEFTPKPKRTTTKTK